MNTFSFFFVAGCLFLAMDACAPGPAPARPVDPKCQACTATMLIDVTNIDPAQAPTAFVTVDENENECYTATVSCKKAEDLPKIEIMPEEGESQIVDAASFICTAEEKWELKTADGKTTAIKDKVKCVAAP